MVFCRIEFIDCLRMWSIVKEYVIYIQTRSSLDQSIFQIKSPLGYCLELDPANVEKQAFGAEETRDQNLRNLFRSLEFTLVYNGSDVTYGWNGFMKGMTGISLDLTRLFPTRLDQINRGKVYHSNPDEKYQKEEHSFPLVPGMTPIIYVANEEKYFLGKPFTRCIKDRRYTTSFCHLGELIEKIHQYCGCVPSYMADPIDLIALDKGIYRHCPRAPAFVELYYSPP